MLSRKLFELNWCAGSVLTLRGTQNVRFVSNDPPEIPNEGKSERKPKWEQFATKDEMHRWRTQPNAWKSKIGIFKISEPKVQVLEFMASRKGKLMEMWRARHEIGERQAQVYDSRRQVHFGHELGCAHFFAYRNARIKFYNNETWYDTPEKYGSLPKQYQKGWFLEKIDCEPMKNGGLRYEGLDNIAELKNLKWLSLKDNKHFDDWALDHLVGVSYKTLQYLDLSNCPVTHRGLIALYKMEELKVLVLDSTNANTEFETVCSLLESNNHNLLVKFV